MKNIIMKGKAIILALIMLIAAASPIEANASLSLTMYVGETYTASTAYKVTSVSSGKKSVASVSRIRSQNYRAQITAKKPGKTTVSIRTRGSTDSYNLTVKKLKITAKLTDMGEGNLLLTVENKTTQTFETVDLRYTLKNKSGKTVGKDTITVSNVAAGKTVYAKIEYDEDEELNLKKCSVKPVSEHRTWFAKYKNSSSSVDIKISKQKNAKKGTVKFTVNSKNKLKKQFVMGEVFILIYDGEGNLVDETSQAFNLSAGKKKAYKLKCEFFDKDVRELTYKVSKVAYYYTY